MTKPELLERRKNGATEMTAKKTRRETNVSKDLMTIVSKITCKRLRRSDYKGIEFIDAETGAFKFEEKYPGQLFLRLFTPENLPDKTARLMWQGDGGDVSYFINTQDYYWKIFRAKDDWSDLEQTDYEPPKMSASQSKNILALLALTMKEQWNNPTKHARACFTFAEYAKARGYDDISGKAVEELQKDLEFGAITSYRIKNLTLSNGAKLDSLGTMYSRHILFPKGTKGAFGIITWNEPYSSWIISILHQAEKQFFRYPLKEIADRYTTQNETTHFLFRHIVSLRKPNGDTLPRKVRTLLEQAGANEQTLSSPKKCFVTLKKCLVYLTENYPEEIAEIRIHKDEKTTLSLISSPESAEKWTYDNAKKMTEWSGKKDFRDAVLSFWRKPEPRQIQDDTDIKTPDTPKNEKDRLRAIEFCHRLLNYEKMKKFTKEGTEKFITYAWNALDAITFKAVLEDCGYATKPNAMRFIKCLEQKLKINKMQRQWHEDINRLKDEARLETHTTPTPKRLKINDEQIRQQAQDYKQKGYDKEFASRNIKALMPDNQDDQRIDKILAEIYG